MVIPKFGGVDLFEERDVDKPEPGPGEVLVRVVASSVNPIDTKLRADGSFAGLEPPVILGADVSGVVEAIVRRLAVRVGETVLIHGGAGGVGSFAVQIAKASGARVLASAGERNQDTLKELGVDVAVEYTSEDAFEVTLDDTGGAGVDA